jgi:ABC-type oligopeptide transport system substrate-binding subunit
MKRILSVLFILSFALLLVACKDDPTPVPTPTPENNAPVISGAVNVPELVKGTAYDPLTGVTAADVEDGDLTSAIVVTNPVDVNTNGTYTVTYTVTDSDGASATVSITVTVYTPNGAPVIDGVTSHVLGLNEAFDPKADVTATDAEDGDLTAAIVVEGAVDATKVGRYELVYSVEDAGGLKGFATSTVLVVEDKTALYNGVLNLKFATTDVKNTFFAAAERYLLENMVGGIPFYVANSFSLLAARVDLPVDSFIPSYGWGTRYATVTADDSQVLDVEGQYGEAGKYTYRMWDTQSFSTLNYWTYDDSISADYMAFINGGFYTQALNDAQNGWEFKPELADGIPTAINGTVAANGKISSKTWQIKLKDNLEWAFNANIDTTGYDLVLDANDFIWTYREALNQNYFRAISGGGDFVTEIAGAEEYAEYAAEVYGGDTEPTAAQLAQLDTLWANVGLKKIDDLTLQFTTKNAKGLFDAYYLLAWPAMQQDLYEDSWDATAGAYKYGTNELWIASSGEYIMTSHEVGKLTRYEKNPKYPNDDLGETMWTGYDIIIYASAEVAFQAFLDGKLEMSGVPNARIQEFISDPRLLQTPDATTWRLNINGLQTVEKQQSQFPGSTYEPEPILGYTDFRKALYYILDRQDLQENWVPSSGIGTTYFSNAYYVDPESGIPYRSSTQALELFEDFGGETWGYNKGLALSYLRSAVADAIADGFYVKGTPQAYTEITLEVRFMNLTQSDATKVRSDFVKQAFELLVDNSNYVKVLVDIVDTPFPAIYYDYMMTGDFDIAIGGISGSALDASSFLDVFSSDNRGGFTINWGFDSSLPEIKVTWDHDFDVNTPQITKYFSYDAIATALNGKATIANGDDVPPVLDEGIYADWDALMLELEDFVDPTSYPTFTGADFEVIEDESALGGIWVVLPDSYDFDAVKAVFLAAGWTYISEAEYDGDWCAEFVSPTGKYVIYSEDLTTTWASVEIADYYGIVVPEDTEGNVLPALLFY